MYLIQQITTRSLRKPTT